MSTMSRTNLLGQLEESSLTNLAELQQPRGGYTTGYQSIDEQQQGATTADNATTRPKQLGTIQDRFSSSLRKKEKLEKRKQMKQGIIMVVAILACAVFAFLGTWLAVYVFQKDPDAPEDHSESNIIYGAEAEIGQAYSSLHKAVCPPARNNTTKQVFPNLDYATYGYNILAAFPLAFGHDPGFTHPIFQVTYRENKKNADCTYSEPDGMNILRSVSCSTSFDSQVINNTQSYNKMIEHSAGASFGGFGFKFSANFDYKSETDMLANQQQVFVMTQAKCQQFFTQINALTAPPFHESFVAWVLNLDKTTNARVYLDFISYYGTHFVDAMAFGARYINRYAMSSQSYSEMKSKNINVGVSASYTSFFSIGANYHFSESDKQMVSDFMQSVSVLTITLGTTPPSDLNATKWANQVFDTPVPMSYKLKSIDQLFTNKYMSDLAKTHGIDYNTIRRNLIHVMNIEHGKEVYDRSTNIKCRVMNTVFRFPINFCFQSSGLLKTSENSSQSKTGCHSNCLNTQDCLSSLYGSGYDNSHIASNGQGSACKVVYRMDYPQQNEDLLQITRSEKQECHIVLFPYKLSSNFGNQNHPSWIWVSGVRIERQVSVGIWYSSTTSSKCMEKCAQDPNCIAVNTVANNQCGIFGNFDIRLARPEVSDNKEDKLGFIKVC